MGDTNCMSSMQWRGGGGSESGAEVIFSAVPQDPHRYRRLTLRISPAGGGSGAGRARPRRIITPSFITTKKKARLTTSFTTPPILRALVTFDDQGGGLTPTGAHDL